MTMKPSFDDLKGKVCVITGGSGVLGKGLCEGLSSVGVRLAILGRRKDVVEGTASLLRKQFDTKAIGVAADVLDKGALLKARDEVHAQLGKIDILINCAGGNAPEATTKVEYLQEETANDLPKTFYGLELDGFRKVFDLNFLGTILPMIVFTPDMVERRSGVILNVSSMAAYHPLTKIPAYSAAKASVNNVTEWMAVHLAKVNVRVNAIAPGFFLTNQNRFLLTDEKTGDLTPRGRKIIASTPMEKFGAPEDLIGATLFLLSDLSKFVTGVILPVDGGFNAYSGV
jgi:NAD(P)-dependent dehydrogenase (short-subunit alcohol dehydrogenase family)